MSAHEKLFRVSNDLSGAASSFLRWFFGPFSAVQGSAAVRQNSRWSSARASLRPSVAGREPEKVIRGLQVRRQDSPPTMLRYSPSVNALRVSVVTLPSAPADRANFATASSLGNSEIITASYCPMVKYLLAASSRAGLSLIFAIPC